MLRLTNIQAAFLQQHDIPLTDVLDAQGMSTKEYKERMSSRGYVVAVGVTPCRAHGHTMRGANGHCVMCKPANLTYRKRYREAGYVYVAATRERNDIVKVGYCTDIKHREATLNSSEYGGYTGWKIIASRQAEEKGVLENAIHQKLKPFAFKTTYFHDNHQQATNELFLLDREHAISTLRNIDISKPNTSRTNDSTKSTSSYQQKEYITKATKPDIHKTEKPAKEFSVKPASRLKSVVEIDRRKRKESRSERKTRKKQPASQFSSKTTQNQQSKPVSSASLKPCDIVSFDKGASDIDEPQGGLRWYHWLVIFFIVKSVYIFLRFSHLIMQ